MFSFPLLQGDPDFALKEPQSIVITERLAKKYFRGEDPVGRSLPTMGKFELRVTGVVKDIPSQSHLRFDCLVPFQRYESRLPAENQWNDVSYFTYVELGDRAAFDGLEAKITASVRSHKADAAKTEYHLQPLKRVHLYSNFKFNLPGHGDIAQVLILSAIALFILIIACLNFVGLSTARSSSRAREVGIRKVLGASVFGIVARLNGDFLRWVLLANLAAWPAAYFFMRSWLRYFAYRTPLGVDAFVLSSALSLAIALLTVGGQALRAARADSVRSLRYE
jgi:putative ABC transport system permease protein